MNIRHSVLWLLVLVIGAGCAARQVPLNRVVMPAAIEAFKPGPEGGVDLVWSTADIRDFDSLRTTLQKYDSLTPGLTRVVVDSATSAELSDRRILQLSGEMIRALKSRLGPAYKLVERADANTLRLNIVLINPALPRPDFSPTSRLLAEEPGDSVVARILRGDERPAGGAVTAELLISDARTGELLIDVIDRQFSTNDIAALTASADDAHEAISRWLDRLWTTLSYWNWI